MVQNAQMRIALAQMPVKTLAVEENITCSASFIAEAARQKADLVVLPELWTTGFHWPKNVSIACDHTEVLERVCGLAREHKVWLAGSLMALDGSDRPVNTAIIISDQGQIVARYNKMHLFSMTGEDRYLAAGTEIVCAETPWGLVGLTICYDLRFPELWRSLALRGARLILCPAGFPEPRREHWLTLLRARAIENQCFVAGVNQTGKQSLAGGKALNYFGASSLYDPWGELITQGDNAETLLLGSINLDDSEAIRQNMPVLRDRQPASYDC